MSYAAIKRWTIFILVMTGIGGLAGGLGFLADPSGKAIGMPLDLLKGTVFSDFLIPGFLLFIVIGLGSLIGGICLWKARKNGWVYPFFFGCALVIWIIVQVYLIGFVSFLQPLYLVVGIVEVLLSIILKNKRQPQY